MRLDAVGVADIGDAHYIRLFYNCIGYNIYSMIFSPNISHVWTLFGILLFVTSAILVLRMAGLYDSEEEKLKLDAIIQDSYPTSFYDELRIPPSFISPNNKSL